MSLAIFHPHFVIRIFPSAFCHPHFSIRILSSAFYHPHFSIRILSSAFFYPHFIIRIFLSAFYHPPSAIRHPPSAIRHPPPSGPHFTETLWNLFKQTTSNWWVPPPPRCGNQYRISTSWYYDKCFYRDILIADCSLASAGCYVLHDLHCHVFNVTYRLNVCLYHCQVSAKRLLLTAKTSENFETLKNAVNFLVKFSKNQEIDKVLISEPAYNGKFLSCWISFQYFSLL